MVVAGVGGFVDRRRVGRATVTAISEGQGRWAPHFGVPEADWRRALPEADAAGRIPVGLTVFHIALDGASILVDPGFDEPDDPAGYVTPKLEEVRRSPGLAAALAALGLAPAAITQVLLTHAHPDHCCGAVTRRDEQWTARFPNARHLLDRADWEAALAGQFAGTPVAERLWALDDLGLLDRVTGEHQVVPGVTLIPAPGETPGHAVIRVDSAGERCYVLGDLFHHACEFVHLDWAPPGRDVPANRASRTRLLAEAAPANALLAFTHELFPPWGHARPMGDGYRWTRDE